MKDNRSRPARDWSMQVNPHQPMHLPDFALKDYIGIPGRGEIAGIFVTAGLSEMAPAHDSRKHERQSNFVGNVLPDVPIIGYRLIRHSKLFPSMSKFTFASNSRCEPHRAANGFEPLLNA